MHKGVKRGASLWDLPTQVRVASSPDWTFSGHTKSTPNKQQKHWSKQHDKT